MGITFQVSNKIIEILYQFLFHIPASQNLFCRIVPVVIVLFYQLFSIQDQYFSYLVPDFVPGREFFNYFRIVHCRQPEHPQAGEMLCRKFS
ncbi:hypothetical protein ES705_46043 [subsurface metagenome]